MDIVLSFFPELQLQKIIHLLLLKNIVGTSPGFHCIYPDPFGAKSRAIPFTKP